MTTTAGLSLTGGEALLRCLLPEGIDTVYGVTGGKLSPLMSAIARAPAVRFVGTRHEGAAALMAAGSAAATGRLGVVIGECGSGAGNLVPGLAVANANAVPLLAVTSNNQHYVSYPAQGMFAGMDTQSLMRPVTQWTGVVHDGRRIPELVRTALRYAHTGRRGAVHLDVPQDVLRGTYEYAEADFAVEPHRYRLTLGPAPTRAQVEAAANLLSAAQRPLLIAGGGVSQAGAAAQFRELVRRLEAAGTATQTGIGAIAHDDPNFVGLACVTSGPGFAQACREADVVLAVGCRLSPWLWDDQGPLMRAAKLIHITTDPVSLGQHMRLEVGMLADAGLALQALLDELASRGYGAPSRDWLGSVRSAAAAHHAVLDGLASQRTTPMHPAALAAQVGRHLPAGALVTYDGGHTTFWTNDYTPVWEPGTRFNEVAMTQLGFGLAFAIALKLRHPELPVLNVTGDGAFGFTLQELDTARRYGAAVITVIHNNASWGVIKAAHQRGYGFTLGDDLDGTDYAAIARGFGCHGEVVHAPEEYAPALSRALASGLPAVIDCRVQFVPHPGFADFGRMGSVGLAPAVPKR